MPEMHKCQTGARGQGTYLAAVSAAASIAEFCSVRRRKPTTFVPTKIIEKTVIITHLKIAGGKLQRSIEAKAAGSL
jgi:hypothetical protein